MIKFSFVLVCTLCCFYISECKIPVLHNFPVIVMMVITIIICFVSSKKAPKEQLQTIVLIKFMLNTDLFTKSMKCPYRVFLFPLKKRLIPFWYLKNKVIWIHFNRAEAMPWIVMMLVWPKLFSVMCTGEG